MCNEVVLRVAVDVDVVVVNHAMIVARGSTRTASPVAAKPPLLALAFLPASSSYFFFFFGLISYYIMVVVFPCVVGAVEVVVVAAASEAAKETVAFPFSTSKSSNCVTSHLGR